MTSEECFVSGCIRSWRSGAGRRRGLFSNGEQRWGRGGRGMQRADSETWPPGWLRRECHSSLIASYHITSLSGLYYIPDSISSPPCSRLLVRCSGSRRSAIQVQLLGVQLPSPMAVYTRARVEAATDRLSDGAFRSRVTMRPFRPLSQHRSPLTVYHLPSTYRLSYMPSGVLTPSVATCIRELVHLYTLPVAPTYWP